MNEQTDDSDICQRCSKIMMYDADGRNYCNCEDDSDDSDWYDWDDDDTHLHPFWEGLITDEPIR